MLVRVWKEETLKPKWEGPYLVLLTTETAVRTAERGWTHASRIKGPISPLQWKIVSPPGNTKLVLKR